MKRNKKPIKEMLFRLKNGQLYDCMIDMSEPFSGQVKEV
jgi:hypothetical protein